MTIENLQSFATQRGAIGFDFAKNGNGEIDWFRFRFAFEDIEPMVSVESPSDGELQSPVLIPDPVPIPVPIPIPKPIPVLDPVPFANIPQSMRGEQRWCVWQKHADGRKIPYQVLSGGYWSRSEQSKCNDALTWFSFEEALHCFLKSNGHLGGLSFVLGDGWAGVDFDDVIVDGKTHPQVKLWLESLGGYQEVSQSGRGIKTILRGVLSDRFLGSPDKTGRQFKGIPGADMATEVYHERRFFFLTGNGSGEPIENQVGLNAFCGKLLALKEAMQPKPTSGCRVQSSRKMKAGGENVDTKVLDHIKPDDLSYDEWLSVITACKNAGLSWQEADDWSRRGGVKYKDREVETRWNGLNLDVSWGAVVNLAKRNGYRPLTRGEAAVERLRKHIGGVK